MIMCKISVGLNFYMCNILAELIQTIQVVTGEYHETCYEKKVLLKSHAKV